MNNINELIALYLADKENAWADTTKKSEAHRLAAVAAELDGNPERLWKAIKGRAPYTRLTTWTRVCDFWTWAIEEGHVAGPNLYRKWRRKNAKQFKHVYQPKLPAASFDEARARIESLANPGLRRKALEILFGGLRHCEHATISGGAVIGKGSKPRRVHIPEVEGPACTQGYRTLLRALQSVGLTVHMLRKIAATELIRRGVRESDVLTLMGWESPATMKYYVAALHEEELAKTVGAIHGRILSSELSRKVPKVRRAS